MLNRTLTENTAAAVATNVVAEADKKPAAKLAGKASKVEGVETADGRPVLKEKKRGPGRPKGSTNKKKKAKTTKAKDRAAKKSSKKQPPKDPSDELPQDEEEEEQNENVPPEGQGGDGGGGGGGGDGGGDGPEDGDSDDEGSDAEDSDEEPPANLADGYPPLDDFGWLLVNTLGFDEIAAKELVRRGIDPPGLAMMTRDNLKDVMYSAEKTRDPTKHKMNIVLKATPRSMLYVLHSVCIAMDCMDLSWRHLDYSEVRQKEWFNHMRGIQTLQKQQPSDFLTLVPALTKLSEYEDWWDQFDKLLGNMVSSNGVSTMAYIGREDDDPFGKYDIKDCQELMTENLVMDPKLAYYKTDRATLYQMLDHATKNGKDCRSLIQAHARTKDGRKCLQAIQTAASGPATKTTRILDIKEKRDKAKFFGDTERYKLAQYIDTHRDCNRRLEAAAAEVPDYEQVSCLLNGISCPALKDIVLTLNVDPAASQDFDLCVSRLQAAEKVLERHGDLYKGKGPGRSIKTAHQRDPKKRGPGKGEDGPPTKRPKPDLKDFQPSGDRIPNSTWNKLSSKQRSECLKLRKSKKDKEDTRSVGSAQTTSPKDKEVRWEDESKVDKPKGNNTSKSGSTFGRIGGKDKGAPMGETTKDE